MKTNDSVIFDNVEYPLQTLYLKGWGTVTVGTQTLSSMLYDDDSGYFSRETESIDNKIFFYVDDLSIYLPLRDLAKIIKITVDS